MLLFVSGTTVSLRKSVKRTPEAFGFLTSPAAGNSLASIAAFGVPWVIDNGAFTGFDAKAFHLLAVRAAYAERKPDWVVCPDVVGSAVGTLDLFARWQGKIAALGLDESVGFVRWANAAKAQPKLEFAT